MRIGHASLNILGCPQTVRYHRVHILKKQPQLGKKKTLCILRMRRLFSEADVTFLEENHVTGAQTSWRGTMLLELR